jgi:hypothetical protein
LRLSEAAGLPVVISQSHPGPHALPSLLRWPGPVEPLFSLSSSQDDWWGHRQMVDIARQSANDLEGALRRATELAGPYVTAGHTTQEWAWLWPTFLEGGEKGVTFQAGRFGLTARRLAEALRSDAWRDLMTRPVPIRRA